VEVAPWDVGAGRPVAGELRGHQGGAESAGSRRPGLPALPPRHLPALQRHGGRGLQLLQGDRSRHQLPQHHRPDRLFQRPGPAGGQRPHLHPAPRLPERQSGHHGGVLHGDRGRRGRALRPGRQHRGRRGQLHPLHPRRRGAGRPHHGGTHARQRAARPGLDQRDRGHQLSSLPRHHTGRHGHAASPHHRSEPDGDFHRHRAHQRHELLLYRDGLRRGDGKPGLQRGQRLARASRPHRGHGLAGQYPAHPRLEPGGRRV
jgi:hypothetical protein